MSVVPGPRPWTREWPTMAFVDTSDLADRLGGIKTASNAFELAQVTTYKGFRYDKDGRICEITIEVLDSGAGDPQRWAVVATDEHGRQASGNSGPDLETVLATVHWWDLDRPLPTA